MSYQPIYPLAAPGLTDTLLGTATATPAKKELGAAGQFLATSSNTVQATCLFYNPLQPNTSPENIGYVKEELINTLSGTPVKLRHNGDTIDMELYVDTYSYTQKEPLVLTTPFPPQDPFALPFDTVGQYTRFTVGYVYTDIPVPPRSYEVWDGRLPIAFSPKGFLPPSTDKLTYLKSYVQEILETVDQPDDVTVLAGLASTTKRPATTANTATYKQTLTAFLADHYQATAIPPVPKTLSKLALVCIGKPADLADRTDNVDLALPDGGRVLVFVKQPVPVTVFLVPVKPTYALLQALAPYRQQGLLVNPLGSLSKLNLGDDLTSLLTLDLENFVVPTGYTATPGAFLDGPEQAYFQEWVYVLMPKESV